MPCASFVAGRPTCPATPSRNSSNLPNAASKVELANLSLCSDASKAACSLERSISNCSPNRCSRSLLSPPSQAVVTSFAVKC